ncbi:MAG: acyltransferase [Opitutales bacterium]|nr:acyltransferase [Opitutales bacterium]
MKSSATPLTANFADTKPHYELLDGLRGVAALLVLVYHIFEGFAFAESVNGVGSGLITTLNHGHIAVDFFFIHSGFVVSYAYDDRWGKMSLGAFFKRRLIRLHPMLVMGALIGVAAFAFVGFQKWDGSAAPILWVFTAFLLTVFMVPALPGAAYEVRGNGEMFPLNGPSWSLFFEYVGNILYALFIRRFSTKMLAAFVVVLGVIHAWFFVGNISGYDCVGVGWTIDRINFWGGLVRMLFPFTMGMLVPRTVKPREIKGAVWICSALLLAFFAVPYLVPVSELFSINSLYEFACIAVVFPCIVWLGACGKCSGNTAKINRFLGELSYPLYIVHYPLMYIFYAWLIEKRLYTWSETWLEASLVLGASVVLAYLCLKFYDEPIRKSLAEKFIKTSGK